MRIFKGNQSSVRDLSKLPEGVKKRVGKITYTSATRNHPYRGNKRTCSLVETDKRAAEWLEILTDRIIKELPDIHENFIIDFLAHEDWTELTLFTAKKKIQAAWSEAHEVHL